MSHRVMKKTSALDLIKENIKSYGYHVYVVAGGPLPRFLYTIGLTETVGFELIIAGASFYSSDELKIIIDLVAKKADTHPASMDSKIVDSTLGSFTLQKTDDSWVAKLMLGALDFYRAKEISALQIVPDVEHWSIDTPDLSNPWAIDNAPIWRWLYEPWGYQSISDHSVAITNLRALRGGKVTEAAKWEEDQWELFAGSGPDTPCDEIRVVPLGVLMESDASLVKVGDLAVGHALWREEHEAKWHKWG